MQNNLSVHFQAQAFFNLVNTLLEKTNQLSIAEIKTPTTYADVYFTNNFLRKGTIDTMC